MSSTCYNVFLYAWLNDNFRKELKRVLPCFSDGPPTGAVSTHQPLVTPGPTPAVTATTLATNATSACDLRKRSINGLPTIMDSNQPLLNAKSLTPDAPVIYCSLISKRVASSTQRNTHGQRLGLLLCK